MLPLQNLSQALTVSSTDALTTNAPACAPAVLVILSRASTVYPVAAEMPEFCHAPPAEPAAAPLMRNVLAADASMVIDAMLTPVPRETFVPSLAVKS